MAALVAKRYVKALLEGENAENLAAISVIFDALSSQFENESFVDFISAPMISSSVKEEILLAAVEKAKSEKINNFLKLLAEKNRLELIPEIADQISKEIAVVNNAYTGKIFSDLDMDAKTVEALSSGLGKKVNANITLEFVKTNFDGIKVEVEDLGVEINFSKQRINTSLIDHILKAI
jgi:F-type H+-transporting ATPase subunit delta